MLEYFFWNCDLCAVFKIRMRNDNFGMSFEPGIWESNHSVSFIPKILFSLGSKRVR